MAWARTSQKCWGLPLGSLMLSAPVKYNHYATTFLLLFFFSPQSASNPSNGLWIILLVLCWPSMHLTPQHSTTSHKVWSHPFFQQETEQGRGRGKKKGENSKKNTTENNIHKKITPPNQTHFPFCFFFLRPRTWANQTQRIKAEITKRRKQERD